MKKINKIYIGIVFFVISIYIANLVYIANIRNVDENFRNSSGSGSNNSMNELPDELLDFPKTSLTLLELGGINESNFWSPSHHEVITQLYDWDINMSFYIGWFAGLGTPSVTIYTWANRDNDNYEQSDIREMDWTNLTYGAWGGSEGYYQWGMTIDPIMFVNDYFYITSRVWMYDYPPPSYFKNTTNFYIQNDPPIVELEDPILNNSDIVQNGHNATFICNITNEETINTAQYDIVSTLGTYNWNDLKYNVASECYEHEFNTTDLAIGEYYFVVNSTDDKHNSSLTTYSFQIVSPPPIYSSSSDDDDSSSKKESPNIIDDIIDAFDNIWWARYALGGLISGSVAVSLKIAVAKYSKKKNKKKSVF